MGVRDEAKEETREALIRSAIALVAEHGVDRPSLDAICEKAGFTRGAFYVHFRDRDELLVAVLERVGRTFLDGVLGDGSQGLAAMTAGFIAAVVDGRYPLMPGRATRKDEGALGVRPTQLLDACARSKAIRRRYVTLVEEAIARVAKAAAIDAKAERLRKDVSPASLGALLLAIVIGAQTMVDLGVPIDLGEGAATMRALLAPGAKKKGKKRVTS